MLPRPPLRLCWRHADPPAELALSGGAPGTGPAELPGFGIRAAAPAELPGIGRLRVAAYRASGFLGPASGYAATLAALGADGRADVLVAVRGAEIVGTVTVQVPPQPCEIAVGADEHEVRALAVLPRARGLGVGRALLGSVAASAKRRGAERVVLCTLPQMETARRLYARAGFRRLPERDSEPVPGVLLLAYGLDLPAGSPPSPESRPAAPPGCRAGPAARRPGG